jgi:hypothetical protein
MRRARSRRWKPQPRRRVWLPPHRLTAARQALGELAPEAERAPRVALFFGSNDCSPDIGFFGPHVRESGVVGVVCGHGDQVPQSESTLEGVPDVLDEGLDVTGVLDV